MTSKEFTEWVAFLSTEPQGEDREDIRLARLLTTMVNINRTKKQTAAKPADFITDFWSENPGKPTQSWEEQHAFMAGWLKNRFNKHAPSKEELLESRRASQK